MIDFFHELCTVVGFITILFFLIYAVLWLAVLFYDTVWQKFKYRLWVYQAWETFMMWYEWDYKKTSYQKILHWRIVEIVREKVEKHPHIFKRYWRKKLEHMLNSPEYKRYKQTQYE